MGWAETVYTKNKLIKSLTPMPPKPSFVIDKSGYSPNAEQCTVTMRFRPEILYDAASLPVVGTSKVYVRSSRDLPDNVDKTPPPNIDELAQATVLKEERNGYHYDFIETPPVVVKRPNVTPHPGTHQQTVTVYVCYAVFICNDRGVWGEPYIVEVPLRFNVRR